MSIVYLGDFVTVDAGGFTRIGVVINCNSDRCLVRHESSILPGQYDDIWYFNEAVTPLKKPPKESKMEDTRNYLKQITGDE